MVYMSDKGRYERWDYRKGIRRWTEIRYYNSDDILMWTKEGPTATFSPNYIKKERIRTVLLMICVWIASCIVGIATSYMLMRVF